MLDKKWDCRLIVINPKIESLHMLGNVTNNLEKTSGVNKNLLAYRVRHAWKSSGPYSATLSFGYGLHLSHERIRIHLPSLKFFVGSPTTLRSTHADEWRSSGCFEICAIHDLMVGLNEGRWIVVPCSHSWMQEWVPMQWGAAKISTHKAHQHKTWQSYQ